MSHMILTKEHKSAVSSFLTWWAMCEDPCDLSEKPMMDAEPVLHFMGSGASTTVSVGHIRKLVEVLNLVESEFPEESSDKPVASV